MPTAEQREEQYIAMIEKRRDEQERAQLTDFADQLDDIVAQLVDLAYSRRNLRFLRGDTDMDRAITTLREVYESARNEAEHWGE